jgi:hypothetical protein
LSVSKNSKFYRKFQDLDGHPVFKNVLDYRQDGRLMIFEHLLFKITGSLKTRKNWFYSSKANHQYNIDDKSGGNGLKIYSLLLFYFSVACI